MEFMLYKEGIWKCKYNKLLCAYITAHIFALKLLLTLLLPSSPLTVLVSELYWFGLTTVYT